MITIRPSTISDDAATSPTSVASDLEDHKKRIPLVWIPATLGVGLLIAAIYLRGRIVLVHPHPKPAAVQMAAPAIARPVPAPAPPVVTPQAILKPATKPETPKPAQQFVGPELPSSLSREDGIPMVAPRRGELYIQVGALNPAATLRLVARLRREKLDPHVAPGPTPDLMRVLIGPFDNRDALKERKAQLESEGVDTFVRQY
ncbi:MAG: SPOR domain-containing protein [Bryobacteraceae bacterium]|jgi:cell division septation protein DedD